MYFLGIQKYDTKLIRTTIEDVITAGKHIFRCSLTINMPEKVSQQYIPIIAIEIKKATSQMRRCQKRVNVIDLIYAP